MDALKQQLLKVQQQLAGLTASQKMLTASLLVIMVMTLFYWSRFASTGEMVAVIDKAMAPQELADLKAAVIAEGLKYEEHDQRIFVSLPDQPRASKAISTMALNGKLPASYARAEDVEDKGGMWEGEGVRQQRVQDTRRRRLEQIIQGWPGVTDAKVILSGERRIGALTNDRPAASVSITYSGGPKEARQIVDAARLQVVHVQAGMQAADVGITVNGQAFKADDPEDNFSGEGILARRMEAEEHFNKNVRSQLSYIQDVRVNVSVKLNTDISVSTERLVDPKNKVEALRESRTQSDENTQPAQGGEPGTTSNVGIINETTAAGTSSTSEKTENRFDTAIGFKERTVKSPSGDAVPQSATISVPNSYYRIAWHDDNPGFTGEPTPAELKAFSSDVEGRIRAGVRQMLALADEKAVTVSTFYPGTKQPAVGAGSPDTLAAIPAGSGFGAKEIALGALAVISLFMVSMMVRKSAPQPVIAAPGPAAVPNEPAGPAMLSVKELAGEVGEADLTMIGQELSEDALEARQVIEQVGTMVKQNPEIAANLVKRWLNQD